jgi:rRNA maturation endonuclease Nob1
MAEKRKYRCGACKWKFSRNFSPTLCPYCGRAAVEEDVSTGAGDIVREVEELGR